MFMLAHAMRSVNWKQRDVTFKAWVLNFNPAEGPFAEEFCFFHDLLAQISLRLIV
jgi:hypothetical protein